MYTVTSTHELTPEELERAPRGLRRSSIERRYTHKAEAVESFEFQLRLCGKLGFSDRLELRRNGVLLKSNG